MSSERDQNGPTQVQTALYNELTSHMQLNGLNGMNGIGMISKPFGERGKLHRNRFKIRKLPQTLQISLNKISSTSRWKIFHNGKWACAEFSSPCNIRLLVERIELHRHTLDAFEVQHPNLLRNGGEDSAGSLKSSTVANRHVLREFLWNFSPDSAQCFDCKSSPM